MEFPVVGYFLLLTPSLETSLQGNLSHLVSVKFKCHFMRRQRQSLQCSWTSSLELSANGPWTAGLVVQPFQTVAEDILSWSVGPKCCVNLRLIAL